LHQNKTWSFFLNANFLQTKINFKIEAIYHFGGFQFLEALCFWIFSKCKFDFFSIFGKNTQVFIIKKIGKKKTCQKWGRKKTIARGLDIQFLVCTQNYRRMITKLRFYRYLTKFHRDNPQIFTSSYGWWTLWLTKKQGVCHTVALPFTL